MKKLLGILVLGLLWCNSAYAVSARATCLAGVCEFLLNIWYDYAETICMDRLFNEEVDVGAISFTIVETGKRCIVFNERDLGIDCWENHLYERQNPFRNYKKSSKKLN